MGIVMPEHSLRTSVLLELVFGIPDGGTIVTGAEWAFCLALATLGYLSLLAGKFVLALWQGKSAGLPGAGLSVAFGLIVLSVISLPRAEPELTLVAGTAMSAPEAAPNWLRAPLVSGNRVRLSGEREVGSGGVWAVVEDPRTGTLWLQGPALATESAWYLDLVVGSSDSPPRPMPYRFSVVVVSPAVHEEWIEASRGGLLQVPAQLPVVHWLARDRQVTIGG
jgi:hypothetical protein